MFTMSYNKKNFSDGLYYFKLTNQSTRTLRGRVLKFNICSPTVTWSNIGNSNSLTCIFHWQLKLKPSEQLLNQ